MASNRNRGLMIGCAVAGALAVVVALVALLGLGGMAWYYFSAEAQSRVQATR